MKNACTIYLVRHGESEANIKGLFGMDTSLTNNGKEQANNLATSLKNIHFDAVFSSPLERAKQTADIIALERRIAVETKELLRERNWGSIDGKQKEEVRRDLHELFEKAKHLSTEERFKYKVVPDMESEEEMMGRYITALREIAIAYTNKNVLIVSHQTIMRTFLMHIGYATYTELPEGSIQNSGYIKLLSDGIEFEVVETKGVVKKDSWF
ncbi:MAG: 2,3-bisphosphoglycerate-dependent phosphoglycerate mutase [Patescibacteria group bacterium]|nr:2,3-bisphosphoglycerate-dependent phosphoglycerate mutase [Patescibacteria group bacterium]